MMAPRFEADPLYGTACESYQLQVGLAGVEGLVAAQRALAGPGLHGIPASALHVTVLPLIDAAEHPAEAKAVLWARHRAAWCNAIARACAGTGPFRMRFDEIRVGPRAVIAQDGRNPLAALRALLHPACGLPERPVRVPDITHATLLRVAEPDRVQLPPLPDLSVEVPVTALRLVRETVFPSLAVEPLADFRL